MVLFGTFPIYPGDCHVAALLAMTALFERFKQQFVAAGNFAIDISHRLEYAVGSTACAAGKKGDFIMTVREIVDS